MIHRGYAGTTMLLLPFIYLPSSLLFLSDAYICSRHEGEPDVSMLTKRLCELFAALMTAAEVFSYSFLPPSMQWIFMFASVLLFIGVCIFTRDIRSINPMALIVADLLLKLPIIAVMFKILYTILSYKEASRPLHWNDYECAGHYGRYQCLLYGRSLLLLWTGMVVSVLCFLFEPPVLWYLWKMRKSNGNSRLSRDCYNYNSTYRDSSNQCPNISSDSSRVSYPTAAEPVTTVASSLSYQYPQQGYQNTYGYPTLANPPPPYSP